MKVRKLFNSKHQSHGSGVVVVCGAYVSSAVGLEEVLVAAGFVGHALLGVGILTEVGGWCASEPVGFITAPAVGEGREVALRL